MGCGKFAWVVKFDLSLEMRRHELSDEEWNRIEPVASNQEITKLGDPTNYRIDVYERHFYIAKNGDPWRDLPERFGPWKDRFILVHSMESARSFPKGLG